MTYYITRSEQNGRTQELGIWELEFQDILDDIMRVRYLNTAASGNHIVSANLFDYYPGL